MTQWEKGKLTLAEAERPCAGSVNASAFEDSGRFQQAEKEDGQAGTIWADTTGRAVETAQVGAELCNLKECFKCGGLLCTLQS